MPQPPFSRTISEGSGDGAGLKVEGNTFSRPFGEDFLQDVISVQWNSGLFFASDNGGGLELEQFEQFPQIFYSKGGNKWTGPVEVDNSNFASPAQPATSEFFSIAINSIVGGKIHDGEQGKILLLGGIYDYLAVTDQPIKLALDHELLSYSYDGITWTPVTLPYNYDEPEIHGNVPDIETIVINLLFIPETKLFYADVEYLDSIWTRDLWSSGDGVEWSKVSSSVFSGDPDEGLPGESSFVCDFINLALSNQDDNGLTGVTNPQTGTVLKFSNVHVDPNSGGGQLLFNNPVLRNEEAINIPGLTVDGLCYAGGTFLVSGHAGFTGIVYKSTDDGKTWKQVLSTPVIHRVSQNGKFFCGGA